MEKTPAKMINQNNDLNDVLLTRMYFSTSMEVTGRIMILIAQVVMLGVIVIISASLAMIGTSKLPIPAIFNKFGVADATFRGLTIVIAAFGIVCSFAFVIPTLIVRNIRSLKITGLMFTTVGSFFTLLILSLSIIAYLYIPVRLNFPGIIMAGTCVGLIFIGSTLLRFSARQHEFEIKKAQSESMSFTT